MDGQGTQDYTNFLDRTRTAKVLRRLNRPAEFRFSLITTEASFVVPVAGARVRMARMNGSGVFGGYVEGTPSYLYLGWGEKGPIYRYDVVAVSDEILLDKKTPQPHSPFVARSAGEALR